MKIFIARASGAGGTHLVTQLVARGFRDVKRMAAATDRLRIEGTDHLLAPTKHRRGNPA